MNRVIEKETSEGNVVKRLPLEVFFDIIIEVIANKGKVLYKRNEEYYAESICSYSKLQW